MVTIPENKKRDLSTVENGKMKVWVFGAPYSGKTYFANSFPDALILSTDGNAELCDSPSILIRDQVTVNGRITTVQPAWDYFEEVLTELAKKQNTYKTLVFDLVDDLYEMCRLAMYTKLGIKHEKDDPFSAWDIIRTKFVSTMRKASNLDYNIVFISHEDVQIDITSRGGDQIKAVNPNMHTKMANKLSGMVDMTLRAVETDKGENVLLIPKDGSFGGIRQSTITAGKIELPDSIPNTYNDFENLYNKIRRN